MRWLSCALALVACFGRVVMGDTEIVNLRFPLSSTSGNATFLPVQPIHGLSPRGDLDLNVTHTEPEHWIHLEREKELEDYKAWTVRISWPASHPTKFNLKAYSQSPNSILLHVNASALSPRFRHPHGLSSSPADPHHSYGQISTHVNANFFTPIHLVFEPLYLGFLPRTALLAVFWVSIFAVGAAILLPWIHRTVEGILEWSGEEWRYESDGKRENTGLSSEGEGARSFGSGTGVRQRGENRKEAKAHAG